MKQLATFLLGTLSPYFGNTGVKTATSAVTNVLSDQYAYISLKSFAEEVAIESVDNKLSLCLTDMNVFSRGSKEYRFPAEEKICSDDPNKLVREFFKNKYITEECYANIKEKIESLKEEKKTSLKDGILWKKDVRSEKNEPFFVIEMLEPTEKRLLELKYGANGQIEEQLYIKLYGEPASRVNYFSLTKVQMEETF